jgi:hypothetical protein
MKTFIMIDRELDIIDNEEEHDTRPKFTGKIETIEEFLARGGKIEKVDNRLQITKNVVD